ncbi:caspase family protein, partial [Dissulfuribacter thermophilus]|uniref:caspase family protein n=1 Tax=Dissulfuribacter thermophilus TaxID=1156395 RepID=UPI0008352D0D
MDSAIILPAGGIAECGISVITLRIKIEGREMVCFFLALKKNSNPVITALFILFCLVFVIPVLSYASRGITPVAHISEDQARRVALVIGNGAYGNAPLKNPPNDARDMGAKLKRLGFDVTLLTDADQRTMEQAIRRFGRKLRQGGTGLFYYAGHGLQVEGRNYLIPVDAKIYDETDVKYKAVDVGLVLDTMNLAGNGLNIIILDACRSNPYTRSFRSAVSGLARMDAPTGTLIAYATGPGKVAEDGTGRNGIYTKHLLKYMEVPGLPVEQVFKNVRKAVIEETGGRQVPWESSSLIGDFFFLPGKQPVKTATSAQPPKAVPIPVKKREQVSEARQIREKAISLYEGTGGRIDHEEAILLFIEAEEKGDPMARMWLAMLYYKGGCGFKINPEKAKILADQAIGQVKKEAGRGDVEAMFLLGSAYADGLGIEKDYEKAVYWFRKAAEKGEPLAMNNLGFMYENGLGVSQDYAKAFYWYQKAAEKGEPLAMNNLGFMYMFGLGVSKDCAKAAYWYQKAAKMGNSWAMSILGLLYENGLGVSQDYAKAFYWYQKAAE